MIGVPEYALRPAPAHVCPRCGWAGPASDYPCPSCGHVWPGTEARQGWWVVTEATGEAVSATLVPPADLAAHLAAHPAARARWRIGVRPGEAAL